MTGGAPISKQSTTCLNIIGAGSYVAHDRIGISRVDQRLEPLLRTWSHVREQLRPFNVRDLARGAKENYVCTPASLGKSYDRAGRTRSANCRHEEHSPNCSLHLAAQSNR
jgi:hypothetical protein